MPLVELETSHTRRGELCGLEKCGFKNLWEINPEFKNTLKNLAAENKLHNLKELGERDEHHDI